MTGPATPPSPTITTDQLRMFAIGILTSAANALTMGGSADRFALDRVYEVLPMVEALGQRPDDEPTSSAPETGGS